MISFMDENLIRKKIPNALTLGRIALLPCMVTAYYADEAHRWAWVLALFALASLTDFLDGWLARRWAVESDFGRMLDPIADKLLVAVALVLLMAEGVAHPVAVLLILGREILVAGIRDFLAHRGVTVHVTQLAKWKTAVQLVALCVLIGALALAPAVLAVGEALLWLAVALTVLTGAQYARAAQAALR